jgi:hypothetical protein
MDLIGQKFGRLTVIERGEKIVRPTGYVVPTWVCSCSCGKYKTLAQGDLRKGDVNSCGCINWKHGFTSDGATAEQRILHKAWTGIVERAIKSGYETDLTLADMPTLTNCCPVFQLPYQKGTRTDRGLSPSIDRFDSSLPYTREFKNNLVFISYRANRLKSNATLQELKSIHDYLTSHFYAVDDGQPLPVANAKRLIGNIRNRSKRRKYVSDLEILDLPLIGKKCPVFHTEYQFVGGRKHPFLPALDRFDSNLPYLKRYKNNLRFISYRANEIKCNGTIEEFKKVIAYVEKPTVEK